MLRGGADVVLISSGLMTMRALQAADELAKHRVDVAVVHTPTLKPFDAETVLAEVDSDRLAVTLRKPHRCRRAVRNCRSRGGAARAAAGKITPMALPDEFLAAGALPTLHDRYGLSTARIVAAVTRPAVA